MGNLSFIKEKNIIDCRSIFLEKSKSINKINKTFSYTVCTIQDLYDITSLKNGVNIDFAAQLIFNSKNIKIISHLNKKNKNLLENVCKSFKLIGINANSYDFNDEFELKNDDIILMLSSDLKNENYKKFLIECVSKKIKIIKISSEKNKIQDCMPKINLYHLDCAEFDKLLCLEVLLQCVYLGILAKYNAH